MISSAFVLQKFGYTGVGDGAECRDDRKRCSASFPLPRAGEPRFQGGRWPVLESPEDDEVETSALRERGHLGPRRDLDVAAHPLELAREDRELSLDEEPITLPAGDGEIVHAHARVVGTPHPPDVAESGSQAEDENQGHDQACAAPAGEG